MARNAGDWSREEVEATVADYFAMLAAELGGLPYSKTEHRRRLLAPRSDASVEFKHANVSAVLTRHGYPYIEGYKPRMNFQALLEQVVLEHLDVHRLARIDFVARDAANRDLGRRGEEFVLEFERRRLHDVEERRDLARRIEWTARERGDGAGYDIKSFNRDGTARLLEVKTTGLGKYVPFNVTANEVRCSQAVPEQFHLYRVFRFGERPRLYALPGALSETCGLDATQYRAYVGLRQAGPVY